jgi:hypothetical protein
MPKRYVVLLVAIAVAVAAALPSIASHRDRHVSELIAALSGQEETQAADDNGYGAARFEITGRRVCFVILAREVAPITAGHIHRGAPSVAGPIVVDLLGASPSGLPPRTRGCVRTTRALAREIGHNPGRFYVNLHNADFPDGAIRGQLTR